MFTTTRGQLHYIGISRTAQNKLGPSFVMTQFILCSGLSLCSGCNECSIVHGKLVHYIVRFLGLHSGFSDCKQLPVMESEKVNRFPKLRCFSVFFFFWFSECEFDWCRTIPVQKRVIFGCFLIASVNISVPP